MAGFTTLSIDLGSTCGYCIGRDGVIIESGEVSLYSKESHPGHRWMKFQEWLIKYNYVNEILFEDVPQFKSASAAKVYGALLGVLQIFSLAHGIRMCSLKPTQIKKDFTGYGNAKKDVMCDVAMRLGWRNGVEGTMNNNNECDAIALYWVVCARRGIEPSFVGGQKKLSEQKNVPLDVQENSAVA